MGKAIPALSPFSTMSLRTMFSRVSQISTMGRPGFIYFRMYFRTCRAPKYSESSTWLSWLSQRIFSCILHKHIQADYFRSEAWVWVCDGLEPVGELQQPGALHCTLAFLISPVPASLQMLFSTSYCQSQLNFTNTVLSQSWQKVFHSVPAHFHLITSFE